MAKYHQRLLVHPIAGRGTEEQSLRTGPHDHPNIRLSTCSFEFRKQRARQRIDASTEANSVHHEHAHQVDTVQAEKCWWVRFLFLLKKRIQRV